MVYVNLVGKEQVPRVLESDRRIYDVLQGTRAYLGKWSWVWFVVNCTYYVAASPSRIEPEGGGRPWSMSFLKRLEKPTRDTHYSRVCVTGILHTYAEANVRIVFSASQALEATPKPPSTTF